MSANSQPEWLRLCDIPASENAVIIRIGGCKGMRQRLTDMGFVPHEKVKVIRNEEHGPILVLLKNTKVAIGKDMSKEIYVKTISGEDCGQSEKKPLVIALAGNPNSGKTTIFNQLTGSRQHVGNYPGVTVEKIEGICNISSREIKIIDLPGTYGLSACSVDELVARKFIIEEKPDLIINVIDCSNLERNLYLSTQFMELNIPIVIALNKIDIAQSKGLTIQAKNLSNLLNIPIVPTQGDKKKGIAELINTAIKTIDRRANPCYPNIDYGNELNREIRKIQALLYAFPELIDKYPAKWLAIKALENDDEVNSIFLSNEAYRELVDETAKSITHLKGIFNDSPEIIIADRRYGFISGACSEALTTTAEERHNISDMIDKVLLNRVLGLPIFVGLMWLTFWFVFALGNPLVEVIDNFFGFCAGLASNYLPDGILKSLIVDGIISGVGGVVIFLPNILLLFFGIAVLEDSGYMARAAFIVDRIMHKIGLHGKSFIPMLIGFGCNVPAIMATRILDNKRDRLVTILILPLMSCGARLPIYILLISAFFPAKFAGHVLVSIYLLGIALAILMAKLFRKFIFRGDSVSFVMELPPYRMPTLKAILIHMWERGWLYLKKAGTVILFFSVLVWFFTSYPKDYPQESELVLQQESLKQNFYSSITPIASFFGSAPDKISENPVFSGILQSIEAVDNEFENKIEDGSIKSIEQYHQHEKIKETKLREINAEYPKEYPLVIKYTLMNKSYNQKLGRLQAKQDSAHITNSYAGKFGRFIEPVLRPLGFDWRISIALITGLSAKEIVVSTLSTIFSVAKSKTSTEDLKNVLKNDPAFNPLVAYCLMVFTLIYVPCLASLIIIWRETGSLWWTSFVLMYTSVLAWAVTFIVYRGGLILGFGT